MKRPSTSAFENQLLLQQIQQSQALAAQTSDFLNQRSAFQGQAQSKVTAQGQQMQTAIRRKIAKPVTLGTILTGPQGILGNPILSGSKLGG